MLSTNHFFEGKQKKVYLLDNFTRFKTVQETLLEIIKDVSTQRIGKDNFVIKVKGFDYADTSDLSPIIFVDGCLVNDHNALLQYDARSIEEIVVMKHKLLVGPEVFRGVLFFKTSNGNGYEVFENYRDASVAQIFTPQPNKHYFLQSYEVGGSPSNLPDDRLQLFWDPNFKLNTEAAEISFFTSDVPGEYVIEIEGFTNDFVPVSLKKLIVVD